MSRQEYEALVERMLAMQLKEAEKMGDVDENGLECIDLTDDIGATTSGQAAQDTKPEPAAADSSPMQTMAVDPPAEEPPQMMFKKTQSNNFFAVDDSLDQIQPFDDDEEEEEQAQWASNVGQ